MRVQTPSLSSKGLLVLNLLMVGGTKEQKPFMKKLSRDKHPPQCVRQNCSRAERIEVLHHQGVLPHKLL